MNFDFISDAGFKDILIRDFEELKKCHEAKASKSILILSGSIIEAILVDYFLSFMPENLTDKKILKMDLFSLIELAFDQKLISSSSKDLSTVIKNYRNLIHPGREIRKREKFDNETSNIALSLLKIVIKEIRENYFKNLGYTASEIFHKLESDSLSQPIFERIINNLHKGEKTKLFEMLIGHVIHEDSNLIKNPKQYIWTLRTHVELIAVENQLHDLISKIETGEKWEVMKRYELFHNDIDYLNDDQKELTLLYVLNALSESTKNKEEFQAYVTDTLFASFGTHLNTDTIKKEFLKLACNIVRYRKKEIDFTYYWAYDQLVNSVDADKNKKIKEYVLDNVHASHHEEFYRGYANGDYIPF